MKLLTLLSLATLASILVVIYLIRRQPGQIAFVPMEIEVEGLDDTISVEPAELQDSYKFRNESFWDPERVH